MHSNSSASATAPRLLTSSLSDDECTVDAADFTTPAALSALLLQYFASCVPSKTYLFIARLHPGRASDPMPKPLRRKTPGSDFVPSPIFDNECMFCRVKRHCRHRRGNTQCRARW
jgi:hypothetical protein